MLNFLKRYECKCAEAPPTLAVSDSPEALSTSPARLLARSLTDPETRGEWKREYVRNRVSIGGQTTYTNSSREIEISRYWHASLSCAGDSISTPFTLSKAEEKIVKEAMRAFDKRERDEREAAALARLVAQASEAGTVDTGNTESARRASAPSRKDAPKRRKP